MKKLLLSFMLILTAFCVALPSVFAYDFGNFQSQTLVSKAWGALAADDIEGVIVYTNKCLELYADKAKEMQAGLKSYPTGTNSEIFAYWALNDVATSLFIQGEAFRKKGMKEESRAAYEKVVKEFSYGQCWDPKGWFWKPAEAAKEKIAILDGKAPAAGEADLSDISSSSLTAKAWAALSNNDLEAVKKYVAKCLELYEKQAQEMQASLKTYAWESKDKVFSYWALNDVGTSLYILGKAYEQAGNKDEAKKAYLRLTVDFKFAQCWDPGGWFWKPAEDAAEKLKNL